MPARWISFDTKDVEIVIEAFDFLCGQLNFDFVTDENKTDYRRLKEKLQKSLKQIAIRSAKGKGADLQNFVAREISEMIDVPILKDKDESLIRGREMGQSGTDVILRGLAAERFPYAIECKSSENFSLLATVKQAKANEGSREWLIVHRSKMLNALLGSPVILMSWRTFRKIWERN